MSACKSTLTWHRESEIIKQQDIPLKYVRTLFSMNDGAQICAIVSYQEVGSHTNCGQLQYYSFLIQPDIGINSGPLVLMAYAIAICNGSVVKSNIPVCDCCQLFLSLEWRVLFQRIFMRTSNFVSSHTIGILDDYLPNHSWYLGWLRHVQELEIL